MFEQFKRLFRNSAIYTAGNILNRSTALISMPVLTRYLAPAEYGILSVVSALVTALSFIYYLGLRGSATRFYYDLNSAIERRNYFSSLFFFLIGAAALLTTLLVIFGDTLLAPLLKGEVPFHPYMDIAVVTLVFGTFSVLPSVLMRVKEQAALFVTVEFARATGITALSVLFVVVGGLGALGPLLASLTVTACAAVYFVYYLRPYLGPIFHWAAIGQSLVFGVPTISERLCWWVLNASNRIWLLQYVSLSAAGIYTVSHSMGFALQLVGGAINSAWTPFFYAIARDRTKQEARQMFSYTATYYTLAVVFFGLALALFAHEVFRILASDRYLAGLPIVPWVIGAAILETLYDIPSRGLYLMKRTQLLPLIMVAAAVVTTVLNALLIPSWGLVGAAVATLTGYATLLAVTLGVSQRIYFVPYQYLRLGKIFLAAGTVYAATLWLSPAALLAGILIKAAALVCFPLVLYAIGFFEKAELSRAGELVRATLRNKEIP